LATEAALPWDSPTIVLAHSRETVGPFAGQRPRPNALLGRICFRHVQLVNAGGNDITFGADSFRIWLRWGLDRVIEMTQAYLRRKEEVKFETVSLATQRDCVPDPTNQPGDQCGQSHPTRNLGPNLSELRFSLVAHRKEEHRCIFAFGNRDTSDIGIRKRLIMRSSRRAKAIRQSKLRSTRSLS
jgi:hypothetical protein